MSPVARQSESRIGNTGWRGLAAAIPILILIVIAGTLINQQAKQAQRWVTHTHRVKTVLTRVLSVLQDAETGQRGFLLTGQDHYLEPFNSASSRLASALAEARTLTADNASQQLRLDQIDPLVAEKMRELHLTIELRKTKGLEAALAIVATDAGKLTMDRLRALIGEMDDVERALLVKRERDTGQITRAAEVVQILGVLLLIVIGTFVILRMRHLHAVRAENERQLRESEAALQRAQRLQTVGQLTGGVAHDFNNLMAVIIGNAELLADHVTDNEPARRNAEAITRAIDRGKSLTNRLLAYSRQQILLPQPTQVNDLVLGLEDMLRRTLGEAITITLHLGPELRPAMIDSHQFENALVNLAINARDAMPSGGNLSIETSHAHLDQAFAARHEEVAVGDFVRVAIQDTGEGIPPDVLDRIFEPFFTTKDVGVGSGLGLSMVYGFIKQSNGHIAVNSEVGRGTTVELYLPQSK